jgi:hypothetical protein
MKINKENLGKWSIDLDLFNKILELLPKNKTILEFGSGTGTAELSKYYNMYSIEHDKEWLNKFDTNYIYAPVVECDKDNSINWYDINRIKDGIKNIKYDLILVDGPPGTTSKYENGRMGFYHNLDLFNIENKIIIFDDLHRDKDYDNMTLVAEKTNRKFEIFNTSSIKKYGILYP